VCNAWTFSGKAAADPTVNHTMLVIANGARGGQTADLWDSPADANYDRVRDSVLTPAGLSEAQVQIVWLGAVRANPTVALPDANSDAYILERWLGDVARSLKVRYPNLRQVLVSSRTYAGFATSNLNPEPYAYETGFAFKWLVEAQIRQLDGGTVDLRVPAIWRSRRRRGSAGRHTSGPATPRTRGATDSSGSATTSRVTAPTNRISARKRQRAYY